MLKRAQTSSCAESGVRLLYLLFFPLTLKMDRVMRGIYILNRALELFTGEDTPPQLAWSQYHAGKPQQEDGHDLHHQMSDQPNAHAQQLPAHGANDHPK